MISQVQPQEETQERLKKAKPIMLPGPIDRWHATLGRTTWKSTSMAKKQKTGTKGAARPQPLLGFLPGQGKQFGIN